MIEKLASSLDTMTNRLERRISDIEGNIERKLTAKFNTVITDLVKSEVRQARDEMKIELDLLKDKCDHLDKSYSVIVAKIDIDTEKPLDHKFDIVIKNLPMNPRENSHDTALKLNIEAMVKDGLKIQNINITNVVRKPNFYENKPGIAIVSFDNMDNKRNVMKSKKPLRDSRKYRDVYVENYKSNDQRRLDSNNRRLLKAVGKDQEYISVSGQIRRRGTTVTVSDSHNKQNSTVETNNYVYRPRSNSQNTNDNFRQNNFNGRTNNGNRGRGGRGQAQDRGRRY